MCPDLCGLREQPTVNRGTFSREPLAQHRRGGNGTKLAPEFGQGRVPPLPRPLGTLAVHEPPDARLRDTTLTKQRLSCPARTGHRPRVPGDGRGASARGNSAEAPSG